MEKQIQSRKIEHSLTTHRHFALHKPYGVISQFTDNNNGKKKLLGDLYSFPEGTMAIGRLDEKSEGLLLLTTDGKTSMSIRSKAIEKEYYVQVDGNITADAINLLQKGVEIGIKGVNYKTLPCKVNILNPSPEFPERLRRIRDDRHGPTSWVSITITEGKYRQIRKMTAAVGFPTLRLIRVRIGEVRLNKLAPGQVRIIDQL